MAYTFCANEFNSTPFSSCCRVASMGSKCDRCSVPVIECARCGASDYGDNPEAHEIRKECENRGTP